jgi:hypothetical protein
MTHTEYMRTWRARHPEYAEYLKRWREANKEHVTAYRKEYYEENREENLRYAHEWQTSNPERFALQKRVNFANQRYPGTVTVSQLEELIERSARKCYWCGKTNLQGRELTLEHLRPTNAIEDLAIACSSCNATRRTMGLTPQTEAKRLRARGHQRRRSATISDSQRDLNRIKNIIGTMRRRYPGAITVEDYRAIVAQAEGKCYWCDCPVGGSNITIEHLQPINDPQFMVVACRSCNARKLAGGRRTPADIRAHREQLRTLPTPMTEDELRASKIQALREWRERNPERSKDDSRKFREANRELVNARSAQWKLDHADQVAEYKKQYREEHFEQEAAQHRAWANANRERLREIKRAWNEANPEKVRAMKAAEYQRNKARRDTPENREKRAAALLRYRETHKEEIAARAVENRSSRNAKARARRATAAAG